MELSLLNLLFVLIAAWVAGHTASRFGYPAVLGELVAGIILGPPLLGLLHGDEALDVLANVGVLLMMLYIGMEINPRDLKKSSWAGGLAAFGGFATPFVMAYFVVIWFGGSTMGGIFVGIAAGITSLATKSRILVDLNLLDTRIAHVMMTGALFSDTLSLIIFAAVVGVAQTGAIDVLEIALVTLRAVAFFAGTALIGIKLFPYVGKKLTEAGYTGRTFTFTLVLIIAVLFGEIAELAGLHAILGAFIAGLFLQENVLGRSLAENLTEAVREASIGFLAPIFFVTAGFAVSFSVFQVNLGLFLSIMAVATIGKILGTALFYLPTGYGWREGVTIGAGMNGRGAVEIIVAGIGLEMGLISSDIFSVLVFMAIITTAAVPLFLKWGTDWLRGRNELVRTGTERTGILIIGAGPLAQQLASALGDSQSVWLVDTNAEHCETGKKHGLSVVCGNALQENVMSEAHAGEALTVVVMTPNAEVNTLAAQAARDVFGIPNIIVLQSNAAGTGIRAALQRLQGTVLFGGPVVPHLWSHRVFQDEVALEAVPVDRLPSRRAQDLYKALVQETNRLPVAVDRGDAVEVFHSGTKLGEGDKLLVLEHVSRVAAKDHELDRFAELVERCPILDLDEETSDDDLFRLASEAFVSSGIEVPAEELEELFHRRERAYSSVLVPRLAVPHVVVPGSDIMKLVVARSLTGIQIRPDEDPVHAIFFLVRSAEQRGLHLRVLASIAQIVQDPLFDQKWFEAAGPEEIRRILAARLALQSNGSPPTKKAARP